MTCAAEGETVLYDITVTNTGDIMLAYGEVYDFDVGFYGEFWDLAPGASVTWTVGKEMPVGEWFTNYAWVDACDFY